MFTNTKKTSGFLFIPEIQLFSGQNFTDMIYDSFEVTGGHSLKGDLVPQGAKNEALQVLCATMLTSEKVTISNIPNIKDVNSLIDLLKGLNVEVQRIDDNTYSFQANEIDLDY